MSNKDVSNKEVSNSETPENMTHSIDEQQLLDDEMFINSLYDEVEQSNQKSIIQPNELLDRRIINAARQAVSAKQVVTKKQSRLTWFSGLATAASLTLVVSLVVQQQGQILPSAETSLPKMNNHPAAAPMRDDEANDVEMFTTKVLELSDHHQNEQVEARQNAINSKAIRSGKKSLVVTTSISTEKRIDDGLQGYKIENMQINPTYQLKEERELVEVAKQMAHKPQAKGTLNRSHIAKMSMVAPTKKNINIATSAPKAAPLNFQVLTVELFKQYVTKNNNLKNNDKLTWSLISEQENSYQIMIQNGESASTYYQLDKTRFSIEASVLNSLATSVKQKFQLTALQLKN